MSKKLEKKNLQLKEKQKALDEIRNEFSKLKSLYEKTFKERNYLVEQISLTSKRILVAEKLTNLLSDEGVRWEL